MKYFRRSLLTLLGLLLLLLAGIHFIIRYKSKTLLKEVVNEVSKGTYKAEVTKVNITYFPAGIRAENLSVMPVQSGEQKATMSFALVEVKLNSIWGLLFQRTLDVRMLKAHKPAITAYAKNKSGARKKGIAETIKEIQLSLFKALDILNVRYAIITEASLKIFSAENEQDYFSVNHLNLTLHEIDIEKGKSGNEDVFKVKGMISLLRPDIHLADTTVAIKIGLLKAQSEDRSMVIDSLDLRKTENENVQHIQLSSVRAVKLNWERFLDEGLFELDSLVAVEGAADISILPKNKERKIDTAKTKAPYKGNSFIIHNVAIKDISYKLATSAYIKKKQDNLLMSLQGDSVILKEFSLINGRKPAFSVEELNLRIKNFEESDERNEYQFSLGDLSIRENTLILRGYQLESTVGRSKEDHNKVLIKELRLENYSLDEIFQKRLAASKITVVEPEVVVNIRKKQESTTKPKKAINEAVADITRSISPKVNLGLVAIENGAIRLLPADQPDNEIKIAGLSLVVDATKATKSRSLMDLIHSVSSFSTDGFHLMGTNVDLDVRNMELLTNPRGLRFGIIEGQFGAGTYVKLHGITLMNTANDFDITNREGLHISHMMVDSGLVEITVDPNKLKKEGKAPLPPIMADHFDLSNIRFKIAKQNQIGISAALDLKADDFSFRDGLAYWSKLEVGSEKTTGNFGTTQFNSGQLRILQPGFIEIINASGNTTAPNGEIKFNTERMLLGLGISSSAFPALELESIQMMRPKLELDWKKASEPKLAKTKAGDKKQKDITLKKLDLVDPTFDLVFYDNEGIEKHKSFITRGSLVLENLVSREKNDQPEISADRFYFRTTSPKSEFGDMVLNPEKVELNATDLVFRPKEKFFSLHVDSARLHHVSQTIIGKKQDTLQVHFNFMGITNYRYAKGDSLNWKKLLTSVNWWAQGGLLDYRTPAQLIYVKNPSIAQKSGLQFAIDSFSIKPRLDKAALWATSDYEKPYLAVTGGKLRTEGLHIDLEKDKPAVHISKLYTNDAHLTVAKDKTKLEDTISYRPLLGRQIMGIPLNINIDSILIANARVDAGDISKKTAKETHIFFTEISGYVSNFKTQNITATDTLDTRLRTRFYGTDQLRLHYKQSYADSLQGFWMRARMSKFSMPEMNQLLVPLIGFKIQSGQIDSMLLVVNGNDYFAYGTMDLRYHNLKGKLLPRPDNKKKFTTGLANFVAGIFLRKHDNGHTDLLYQDRLRKRGIFNFWGKIALEGLLTNLGVRRDKKEARKFKKSIKQYNLPEKYWQNDDD